MKWKGNSRPIYLAATMVGVILALYIYFQFFQSGVSAGESGLADVFSSNSPNINALD